MSKDRSPTVAPTEASARYEIAVPISQKNGASAIGQKLLIIYDSAGDEFEIEIDSMRVKVNAVTLMQVVDVLRTALLIRATTPAPFSPGPGPMHLHGTRQPWP